MTLKACMMSSKYLLFTGCEIDPVCFIASDLSAMEMVARRFSPDNNP